jgi:hypothetical protein
MPNDCTRCKKPLGQTAHFFGTIGPLCEFCFERVERDARNGNARRQRRLFSHWLARLLWWR